MPMSAGYKKELAENEKFQDQLKQDEINEKSKVYFAPASRHSIANFHKEVKAANGEIISPEGSLTFVENILITENVKKQKFIESSREFRNGTVKLCKDMKEAMEMKKNVEARKAVKEIESVSSTRT